MVWVGLFGLLRGWVRVGCLGDMLLLCVVPVGLVVVIVLLCCGLLCCCFGLRGSLVVMIWGCLCWRCLFGWVWVFVCGCVSNFRLTVVLCISGY